MTNPSNMLCPLKVKNTRIEILHYINGQHLHVKSNPLPFNLFIPTHQKEKVTPTKPSHENVQAMLKHVHFLDQNLSNNMLLLTTTN